METVIYRERKAKKYLYAAESKDLSGESNYTFGIALSKIKACRGDKQIAIIHEKFVVLKLLCKLLLNVIQLAPYEVRYKDEKPCKLRVAVSLAPKLSGKIGEHTFELRIHGGNICSLMKDDIQIAKFKKRAKSEFERNIYDVFYLNENDFELCFLFCMLADVLWFKNDTEWHAVRYETGVIPFDNCTDRMHWMP